jgi:hypothetical protein
MQPNDLTRLDPVSHLRREPGLQIVLALHLQQHHREAVATCLGRFLGHSSPEHAIEPVAQLLELQDREAIEADTGGSI